MRNWNNNRLKVVGFFFSVFLFSTGLKAQKTFTVSDCINYAFGHNQLLNALRIATVN